LPEKQPRIHRLPTAVKSLAFHPNGRILAVGDGRGQIGLWDVALGKPLGALPSEHRGAVTALAFHPTNGALLLSGSEDANLCVWDVLSRSLQKPPLTGWHQGEIRAVAFRPDGQFAVSCSMDDRLRVWRTSDWQVVLTREGGRNWALALAFSPDGALIASASKDETVKVWRAKF
jgi:WD40 repeat protein